MNQSVYFTATILAMALTGTAALGATNQGNPGGLNQQPALPTVSPHNPDPASAAEMERMDRVNTGSADLPAAGSESPRRQLPADSAQTEMQRSTVTEITFATGNTALSAPAKQKLNQILRDGRRRGPIESVKVLSWGDISYPSSSQPAPSGQVDLAEKRAEAITAHLGKRYSNVKIETYNMAERPSALADLLNQSDARVKNALESAGLAGSGKGSRAMVMVVVR